MDNIYGWINPCQKQSGSIPLRSSIRVTILRASFSISNYLTTGGGGVAREQVDLESGWEGGTGEQGHMESGGGYDTGFLEDLEGEGENKTGV